MFMIRRGVLQRYVSTSSLYHSRPPKKVRLARKARLLEAMQPNSGALRIAVDCSVDTVYSMSEKLRELKKLAKQIQYMYSLIAGWPHPPPRLFLTGLAPGGRVENALRQHIPGYDNYVIESVYQPHYEYFDLRHLVYLNPYSSDVLQEVKNDRVYVLGGVVDLKLTKNLTETMARRQQIASARLPVAETMSRGRGSKVGHLNLPINTGTAASVRPKDSCL